MWFVLSVLAGLSSALDKVLNRAALRNRENSLAYSVVYLSLVALASLPFAVPFEFQINFQNFLLIISLSIVWAIASATMFSAHINTDVSLSSIISKTRILWTIPFGYLLLGERSTVISLIGILIIFTGLSVLFIKNDYHKHKGVYLVLLSSIFAALGSVLNSYLVRQSLTPVQVTFIMMFGQALVLFAVLITRGKFVKKILSVLKYSWYLTLIAVVLEVFAYTLLNYAYTSGNTSSATAVYMAMSIVIVWIGVLFLDEKKDIWKKIVSSVIVTIGIVVLKLHS